MIKIKRIYEPPEAGDGFRILVDRLWPRGVSKDRAKLDLWMKDIAPSDRLRRWFGHDPERWEEFKSKYARELEGKHEMVLTIADRPGDVTLLYGAKDEAHNQAVVLKEFLERSRK